MSLPFPRQSNIAADRAWMLLLGDLMALLLTFFVLIHAMSQVPSVSWQALRGGLASDPLPALPEPVAVEAGTPGAALSYISALIDARRGAIALLEGAVLRDAGVNLTLMLRPAAVFSDSEALSPSARADLGLLGDLLRSHGNRLSVVVAGDDWSEALTRAGDIADALRAGGYDRPIEQMARRGPADAVALHVSAQAGE